MQTTTLFIPHPPSVMKPERKTRKRKKRSKDPDAPKRGMSSFMFFANDQRSNLRTRHPDMKITEIGKELGRMWKELSEEERKPYQEKADEDKQRYQNEKATYTPPDNSSESSGDEGGRSKKRRKKKNKDPLRPKRAMSSFMFFANDKRALVRDQNPGLKITEVGKKLAELWKDLQADEKQKYIDMADHDKERYRKAMETYKPPPESSSSSSDESD